MISSLSNRPIILYGNPVLGPGSGSSFTEGSIIFAGPGGDLAQDNANLFWDNTNNRLGLGTSSPLLGLDLLFPGIDIGYVARFKETGAAGSSWIQIASPSAGANGQAGFSLFQTPNGIEWRFVALGANGENAWRVNGNGLDVFHVTLTGNVLINNAVTDPTTGSKCLIFGDGTVPSGLDSNTAGLYANDVSGTVNMFAINEAGGSSQLSGFTPASVIFASSVGGFTEDTTFNYDSTAKNLTAQVLTAAQSGGFPRLRLNDTSQAADARLFQIMNAALTFRIKAVNDAETVAQPGFVLDRNGIMTGAGQPTALVTKSGGQTLTTAVVTAISFDTETFDVGACHAAGDPTKLTVPTGGGGLYFIFGSISYANNAVGVRLARVRKNGAGAVNTTVISAVSGEVTAMQIIAIAQLVATDYVELIGYQTSGGNLDAESSSNFGWIKVW